MRAMVVYESMSGNTLQIAAAVVEGLAKHMDVDLVEVGSAPALVGDGADLLVVGGPTHAFGMSWQRTRADAANRADGPLVSAGIGLCEWLGRLRQVGGTAAAAFDTHAKTRLPGSASAGAAKCLRRLGFRLVVPPESFYVGDMTGPLSEGEIERARSWGDALGVQVTGRGREREVS